MTTSLKKESEYVSNNVFNVTYLVDKDISQADELALNDLDCDELRQLLDAKSKNVAVYIEDSEGNVLPINGPGGIKYCVGCPGINVSGVPCGTLICSPTGAEICGNGVDENCNGMADDLCACIPTNPEICGNGIDENCNGMADDLCACIPTGAEICGNGVDENCDGTDDVCACVPTGSEICANGIDENCNGMVDDLCVCIPTGGEVCSNGIDEDCDGTDDVCVCVPTGAEICGNGIDENCNGMADDVCACVPTVCSPTPTPGIDEDCDGNFNNVVSVGCAEWGEMGIYEYYSDATCSTYFGEGAYICQSPSFCATTDICFQGNNHWLAKWNIETCDGTVCCFNPDYDYC